MFGEQKPNLIEIYFRKVKLFDKSFKLFAEKRWGKLIMIQFCNFLFTQKMSTLMMHVLNCFRSVKCLLWKHFNFYVVK